MFDNILVSAAVEKADDMSIAEAGITAVFGYAVVFTGLVILMIVLYCTGAYFKSKDAKAKAAADAEAAKKKAAAPVVAETKPELPLAPGSAGHVKLFDVPDKEAAMIMAIVADKMQKPLNELHFISIKEVK
ncbi:OadG family transporter subunit [Ruminococcus sp.]|uniref:OadG family transporter subunit n=1 Tax=Ruminococcus sp. TaxID=41978 RepID=UPI0025F5B7A2|nr:OadG family transporter subunit [Ruminococcus sp.]